MLCAQCYYLLRLRLGPPVPAGTLRDELFPSSTVTGNAPVYVTCATASATETHYLHVFYKRIPQCPLWSVLSCISYDIRTQKMHSMKYGTT